MKMSGEMEFDFALILDDDSNKLPLNDVTLPQGIWREIFQPQEFCLDPAQKFTRPTYLEPSEIATASQMVITSEGEQLRTLSQFG